MSKFARLDPFARGQIIAFARAGWKIQQICQAVRKKDGKKPTSRAIKATLAKARANPKWRGQDDLKGAGGRPSSISPDLQKKITQLVFRERGSAAVTLKYCRKKIPALRRHSRFAVSRVLHNAGFAWLRRRRKRFVPELHRNARLAFARKVLRMRSPTLSRWCYVDGTVFYLARGPLDNEDKKRRRLGSFVWRMSSGKDGLWSENVGSSLYAAAQGFPVKMWGCLANGYLSYVLLPADEEGGTTHMNGRRWQALLRKHAAEWIRRSFPHGHSGRPILVQDHERCLWTAASRKVVREVGFKLLEDFPKCSPDLNAIEGAWHLLRQRLDAEAPADIETRADFVKRVRRTVSWMNRRRHFDMLKLCTNQRTRCRSVLQLKGARTQW